MTFFQKYKNFIKHASLIFLCLLLVTAFFTTLFMSKNADTNQRNDLLLRAKNIAITINQEDIKNLKGNEADLNNIAYQKLKIVLASIHKLNTDTRFVYLMGIDGDKEFFYVDSEDSNSKDYSPPGQVYEDSTPLDIYNHKNGIAYTNGPYADSWGTWISAYAPVFDTDSGEVLALIGVDVTADDFVNSIYKIWAIAGALTTLLCIIFLLLIYFNNASLGHIDQIESLNTDLQKSHEYLLQAEDMAHVGRFVWDADTNDVEINDSLMKLLNIKISRMSLTAFLAYIPFEEVERIKKENVLFVANADSLKLKYTINSPIFGKRKMVSFCKIKQSKEGKIIHAVCTAIDNTD